MYSVRTTAETDFSPCYLLIPNWQGESTHQNPLHRRNPSSWGKYYYLYYSHRCLNYWWQDSPGRAAVGVVAASETGMRRDLSGIEKGRSPSRQKGTWERCVPSRDTPCFGGGHRRAHGLPRVPGFGGGREAHFAVGGGAAPRSYGGDRGSKTSQAGIIHARLRTLCSAISKANLAGRRQAVWIRFREMRTVSAQGNVMRLASPFRLRWPRLGTNKGMCRRATRR